MIFQAVLRRAAPQWAVLGHNGVSFGGVLAKVRRSPVAAFARGLLSHGWVRGLQVWDSKKSVCCYMVLAS
jgi:hypothetical protein